jgi:PqqD family protein of HPr-rel-A system
MLPPSIRWHVAESSSLLIQHWQGEDEFVVFNSRSGDLHLLNPAATAVLERLIEAPASVDDLRASLNELDPATFEAVLETLDTLGLIGPLP